jgi:hypothetical protein
MIGGEIHYFRLNQRYWEAVLDAARKLTVDLPAFSGRAIDAPPDKTPSPERRTP